MYEEFEARTSYKYLREVIENLKEPICVLGGWAVFFHVNKNFQEVQGRPYLGSRDIDLGFHLKKDCTGEELKQSILAETIKILKEKLKFKALGFRLFKEVHTETEEEIQEGQTIPSHFIFPMYIDLIVDNIPKDFKKIFGFDPIDEPLLEYAFKDKKYQTETKELNKKLILPSPELLAAMKIKSLPSRDKEHKRIKDICDLFALLWYADIKIKGVKQCISESDIRNCLLAISREELQKASPQINHSVEEIQRVINTLEHV